MKILSKNGIIINIVMFVFDLFIVLLLTLVHKKWTNVSFIFIGLYVVFLVFEILLLRAYVKKVQEISESNQKFQEALKNNKSPEAEIRMLNQKQYDQLMRDKVLEFPGKNPIILGAKNDNK